MCVCDCVYVCVFVYVYLYVCVCVCVYMYVCVNKWLYILCLTIVQNTITTIILTMSYISGGVSCGTNAADVQDYIDDFRCDDLDDAPDIPNLDTLRDTCDHLEVLRDSMIASGVSWCIHPQ